MLRIAVPLLVLAVMISAVSLVKTRYHSRSLFIKSEQLSLQAQELDIAWRHLQSDRAELARHARVTQLAKDQLSLVPAELPRTMYIPGKPSVLVQREGRP
ncbi:cell division protein FtsL [Paenalcaligenes hominis]|uniref:cell division protein FtsL n=1 Tax=Paenalcaligenes hominis TaxID=643674 RepID=UPI003525A5E1